MATLLPSLIKLSEKAGKLARLIRSEQVLFELLVEEKPEVKKNDALFVKDFKTLGDVLIQEMIRFDISEQYFNLAERVFGEESNKFTNTLGETIIVSIQSSQAETSALLNKVLNNNQEAANLLAEALHGEINCPIDSKVTDLELEDLDIESLGIWIDPIDGTSEYIRGVADVEAEDGIYPSGLQCALVLIGAFDVKTGAPVMGVINQPFAQFNTENQSWSGRYLWGVSYGSIQVSSLQLGDQKTSGHESINTILSSTEDKKILSKLSTLGKCRTANGAGYKMLCVVEQLMDTYVVSQGTTYKWDTCAPHAILKSLGGGVVSLRQAVTAYHENERRKKDKEESKLCDVSDFELTYHEPDSHDLTEQKKWSNSGGVIAYSNPEKLTKVLKVISKDLHRKDCAIM